MWHEKNLWVLCNANGPENFSLPTENYYDPKPISTDEFASFSHKNYVDKLQEELDRLMLKGCFIFNGTLAMKQKRSREYLKSMDGSGGVAMRINTSCLDELLNLNKMSSDLLTSYHDTSPAIGHDDRPSNIRARKGVIYEANDPQSSSLPSGNQNRPREYTENMEEVGGMTLHPDLSRLDATSTASTELPDLLRLYHESFPSIDHGNRPSSTKARKGAVHEPQIQPQEGVHPNVEGTSSSMETNYENIEKENNFPDKTCVCCLNNALKLGTINGSDDDCTKCCDTMQTGKNTSDSVSSESDTAEEVNMTATDLTAQKSSLQNSSSSEKQDGRNSSSLDNTATSATPLSRNRKSLFTLDDANGSSDN
jgi:hypothetical protein